MDEEKIQSNLKKLVLGFLIICLVIGGTSRYLFHSVTELYTQSVKGRLEERALQYKKSFVFKVNTDLQILRAMACTLENTPEGDTSKLLLNLWEANKDVDFVRLAYFSRNGEGIEVTTKGHVAPVKAYGETVELKHAIQQALRGDPYCSRAFYDPNLGYNTIGYTTPIYIDRELKGVLACEVNTESYASILSSIDAISDVGAVAVLNNEGKVLASTRTHQTQGFYEVGRSDHLSEALRDQFSQALSAEGTQFFQFEYNDMTLYACVMPIDVYSDKLVIVDSDAGISDAASEMAQYTHMISVLFGLTAMLFVAAVLYLNRRHNSQLIQIAYHDRLTGAYNRYKFLQLLEQNWKKGEEYTIAAINIRKFKYINELFSTAQSDQLLKDICIVLDHHLEQGEFFCRDTADTFLIALKERNKDVLCTRLEHIFSEINQYCKSSHFNYPVLFYCGCASTMDCSSKGIKEELMSHVMVALSCAKQAQKANIFFYDMEVHEKEKMQNYIENNMESALQNGEFHMFLQPKVNLSSGMVSGAEALVRWVVDGKQIVFPDQFIPIFERNGFCIQLDYYMVDQACQQIRQWMEDGLKPIPISVNQTKLLFYEDDYVERICAITKRYGVPSKYIVLEILEGLALENSEKVSKCIDRLHEYGFRISMDDFGTGYASLNTLSQLQIDELKLDRSFLIQMEQNAQCNLRKILEVIIKMTKYMNISTVAEGIETAENVQLLRELNCDFGQGYYYSKPIPAAEFTEKFMKESMDAKDEQ